MSDFIEIKTNELSISRRGLVYGVGINDANYMTKPRGKDKQLICPVYRKWQSMLQRCYCSKLHSRQPTYIGATVCEEWLTFSVFKSWIIEQEWEGKELDKDIIKPGNKQYSPDTCCFVPQALNNLLTNRGSARGSCPRGVSKLAGKYHARCGYNGKSKRLGLFATPEAASLVYRKYKHAIVRKIASEQTDPRIMRGLVIHADLILRGIEL